MGAAVTIRSVCRGCGVEGDVVLAPPVPGQRFMGERPAWCVCAAKRGRPSGGPYEAPKGYVARFTFGSKP
jgi:hypothetical protein